ncbi:MAG: hypothetical protein WBS21_01405, partial [Candidatus Acidiferrum sp.]
MPDTPRQATQPDSPSPQTPSVGEILAGVSKHLVLQVQDYAKMSARSLTNLFTPPRYVQDTLDQMDDIGVGSLPIVLLSGFF